MASSLLWPYGLFNGRMKGRCIPPGNYIVETRWHAEVEKSFWNTGVSNKGRKYPSAKHCLESSDTPHPLPHHSAVGTPWQCRQLCDQGRSLDEPYKSDSLSRMCIAQVRMSWGMLYPWGASTRQWWGHEVEQILRAATEHLLCASA